MIASAIRPMLVKAQRNLMQIATQQLQAQAEYDKTAVEVRDIENVVARTAVLDSQEKFLQGEIQRLSRRRIDLSLTVQAEQLKAKASQSGPANAK